LKVPDLAWDATDFVLIQQGQGLGIEEGARQLAKALYRRLITYPGELPAHPDYGCRLRDYAGMPADAWVARLVALEAKRALEADPRVRSVRVEAHYEGDRLVVEALVEPVGGYDLIPVRVEVP
jgi:phage baseplate assembly protein W